jgi:subtilisin family serine protease
MKIAYIAAVCAIVCLTDTASAQSRSDNGIFIDLQTRAESRDARAADLMRKAQDNGRVRVIVGLNIPAPAEAASEAQERAEVERMERSQRTVSRRVGVADQDTVTYEYIPFVSMWVTPAQLRALLTDPNVLNIQEDLPGEPGLKQSVPLIKGNTLWNQGFTGSGWTVAVLDTGVDKTHPMFAGKVVSEACYSSSGGGLTSVCPGGVNQSVAANSGRDCKPRGFQGCDHGTHVAGIAAGATSTLKGVARGARIIAIQVFTKQGTNVVTFDSDWIKGLNRVYALRSKFKIASVNMSLGRGQFTGQCDSQSPAALQIIKKLRAAKIATLVASMNDSWNGDMRLPACISAAIAVGSTTKQDGISSFSNHALQVRHMAPGSDINSAKPRSGFHVLSGTSMATPHVAGAYALLRDVHAGASVDDLSAALECTGTNVTRAAVTEKRINLAQARNYLLNPPRAKTAFNFSNGTQGQQWFGHIGGWTVSNGHLQISEVAAGWKVVTTANCNEGVTISSRMIQQYVGNATGVNGILFKSQFVGGTALVGGYLAFYNRANNGSSNGTVGLLRFDGYNLQTNSGLFGSLCSKAMSHNNLNYNVLTVQSRGGVHKVLLNNQLACSATDFTYGAGRAGIATFLTANGSSSGFGADTFVITPNEAIPPGGQPQESLENGDQITAAAVE